MIRKSLHPFAHTCLHVMIICIAFTSSSCKARQLAKIAANDTVLQYMGRVKMQDSQAVLYWSGTSVTVQFNGTTVTADLKDEKGNNYYYCIIDGQQAAKIKADTIRKTYELAHVSKGIHTVQLFRLTEESAGRTWLYGMATDGKTMPLPPHKHVIQFYGNSITAGYSVDDTIGDSKAPEYFNNYYTYAAATARHYDAEYTNICKSGIGVLISWFPVIMPELYDRIDPLDSNSKWDYSNDRTDIVVVDLLQNDSWLVNKPEHAQFKARFGTAKPTEQQIVTAYGHFITTLRRKHPRAHIICTLGSMDATKEGSPWPGYIQQAVTAMGDKKIYTCFFPYKHTLGHPKRREQQAMADTLIKFIDTHINW